MQKKRCVTLTFGWRVHMVISHFKRKPAAKKLIVSGHERPNMLCFVLHWLLWLPECAASHVVFVIPTADELIFMFGGTCHGHELDYTHIQEWSSPPVIRLYIPSMLIPMIRNDKMNDHNPPSFDRGTYAYPFSHVQGRGSSLFHFFNSALYRRQNQEAEAQLTRFWTCLDCTWAFLLQFSTSHATSHMGR